MPFVSCLAAAGVAVSMLPTCPLATVYHLKWQQRAHDHQLASAPEPNKSLSENSADFEIRTP